MVRNLSCWRDGFLSICLSALCAIAAAASADGPVYSTWDVFEPDKCASIWLIKRHIDPAAVFRFYPRGAPIEEGIAFDTPDAQFRRYHNSSTFETLLRHHELADPGLAYIGRLINDMEVNTWERKALAETREVQEELRKLLLDGDPEQLVDVCLEYFDGLQRRLRVGATNNRSPGFPEPASA